ncbi:Signal recognition particle core component [Dissophora globulifera]|uniref:Signal recognition particle subunit SRP72 n=1 Tax=Dissophora globulifera TaxID=979702 RepID=A0A9P6R866_9FUNG|nr:Signal recognition particle core component [Dissophora globulifera]
MANIQQLFGELERHVKREENDKVLTISDKILALDPKDKDALHCKAITLIRLERYTDALAILNRQLEGRFVFEKAYCLYRTNQLTDGALVIENRRNELRAAGEHQLSWDLRHLEAQMLYRMERYQECIELYAGMLKDTSKTDDAYNDILTNFNACKAAVLYAGEKLDKRWEEFDSEHANQKQKATYELSFNAACAQIAKGDYHDALKLLNEAKKVCREALKEYDEEEVEQEMAILVVQTAYVYQLLGRVEQARELYQSVLKIKALEVTVPAVAANNLVAIQKDDDIFDSLKKIKTATTKALGVKFFSSQKRTIAMNELLLNLYQNKFVACRDTARQLLKSQPDNDALYLILAATTQKQKKTAKALEELREYAVQRPDSIAIQFAIIQLELMNNNGTQDYTAAIESLTRFLVSLPEEEQHRPGYVALLVWLYDQAGQGEKGVDLLSKASAVWSKASGSHKNKGGSGPAMPLPLLRQTAAFKLRSHRYKEAAKDYEELVRADPEDPASIAGLIMAYSEFEPALAEKYGASLPEMKNVMALDVESLEKVVPGLKREYVSTEKAGGTTGARRRPGSRPRRTGARKAHKRKPLLPKNFDTKQAGTADPERWLPKRDRAAARLARTKGKASGGGSRKDMGKGPQGLNMEGGGIGGTGSARIAGREHLIPPTPAPAAPVVEEEVVDVAAIAKAKSAASSAGKKKKSKGKGKW